MANRTTWTPEKESRFLGALADGHTVKYAAKRAGLARSTAYGRRAEDPDFAATWVEAEAEGTEALEEVARRRAVDGTLEPVFWQGGEVGHVRKHHDTLLIFLLKARAPQKYRENVHQEHDGELTVKVVYDDADPAPAPPA